MRLFFALLLGMLLTGGGPVHAQSFEIDVEEVPLQEALLTLRAEAGVDIVFARRLVEDHVVTCRYTGRSRSEALACVLEDTGLQAERVRRRQFVLVEAPLEEEPQQEPALRQPIKGFVLDVETGETLPGVHVYLPQLQLGATTNRAGYFVLPALPTGRYAVQVSHLGYERQDSTLVAGGAPVRFHLHPTTLEAGNVVVEARPNASQVDRAMPGLSTLAPHEADQLPAFLGEQDLFHILQAFPGVQKSGALAGGLSVRGGQTDQNLYLVDGAPVYHPWHAFSLISIFQPDTFQDVRLYRGGFPAEHGGRLSSVLKAQLKEGNREEPKATGALSPLSARFLIESPLSANTTFMLAGRRSYLDLLLGREHPVQDERGRRDTLRTGYHFYDLSAKLSIRQDDRHRLSLSYFQSRDMLDLRLPFDISLDFSSWLRPSDLLFEVDQFWENRLVSGQHQFLPSDRLFLTTTAYYSAYRAQEGAYVRPTQSADLLTDYGVYLRDVGMKVDADYHLSVAHRLRTGVHVVGHRFESTLESGLQRAPGVDARTWQRSRQSNLATVGYLQSVWEPTARWKVRPGLRASYFSGGRHLHLQPRLSAEFAALPPRKLVLRGSASRHVQYLQRLRDRYSLVYDVASSRWVPASAEVRPARSQHLSLEAESRPAPGWMLRAGAYVDRARGVLVPEDIFQRKNEIEGPGIDVDALVGQYRPAQTRSYGAEAEVRLERKSWDVWLSATTGRSLVESEASTRSFRPDHFDLPHIMQGAVTRQRGPWQLTLSGELRSGYPHTVPEARYALGDPLADTPTDYLHRPYVHNSRLPPYLRLDGMLGYTFDWKAVRWEARLHIYNLLNHRNVIGRRYVPRADEVEVHERRGLPLLPLFELDVRL